MEPWGSEEHGLRKAAINDRGYETVPNGYGKLYGNDYGPIRIPYWSWSLSGEPGANVIVYRKHGRGGDGGGGDEYGIVALWFY